MLRHIIALPFLLLTLLAAGVPNLACAQAAAAQECCPHGPLAPCAPQQAKMTQADRLDVCCVAGLPATMAIPSEGHDKHWDGAASPALFFLSTLTTHDVVSPAVDGLRIFSPPLSQAPLYLRTGRLRL